MGSSARPAARSAAREIDIPVSALPQALVTFGPHLVTEEFTGLSQASIVVLCGSWAARYDGVDGSRSRSTLSSAPLRAGQQATTPLIATIRAGPHLILHDSTDADENADGAG